MGPSGNGWNSMSENPDAPVEEKTEIKCPACNSKLFYIQMITDIAFERKVLVQSYFCKKCLFKKNDVIPMESGRPLRLSVLVRNRDDLRITVYRSPSAKIVIPEIGAEIEPGEMSTGNITTIEGILDDIAGRMEIVLRDTEKTPEEMERAEESIENIRNVNILPFTLTIEDETGKSRIQSSRTSVETIDTGMT